MNKQSNFCNCSSFLPKQKNYEQGEDPKHRLLTSLKQKSDFKADRIARSHGLELPKGFSYNHRILEIQPVVLLSFRYACSFVWFAKFFKMGQKHWIIKTEQLTQFKGLKVFKHLWTRIKYPQWSSVTFSVQIGVMIECWCHAHGQTVDREESW